MNSLQLPSVTLCAATSVNVPATLLALRASLDQADFAECLLFTDVAPLEVDARIRVVTVPKLRSSQAYSDFMLQELADHIRSDHALVVQWDGFVLDASAWRSDFLSCDYVGATWPQFSDGYDVGNGGFSLRSKRLLEACRSPRFRAHHPEDVAIGRTNRDYLEQEHGCVFADPTLAAEFSYERSAPAGPTFGFHGCFHLIEILGAERFWQIYSSLDDRTAFAKDVISCMAQLGAGRHVFRRRAQMFLDHLSAKFRRRLAPQGRAKRQAISPQP